MTDSSERHARGVTADVAGAVSTEGGVAVQTERDPLAPPARTTTLKERWRGVRAFDTIVIASVLSVLIVEAGLLVASNSFKALKSTIPLDGNAITILEYACFLPICIICLLALVIPKHNRPILQTFKLGWGGNTPKYILLGLALGFGMNAIVVLVASLNGSISLRFDKLDVVPVVICLVAVLIQSGTEELVERGYLYRKLARNYHSPLVPILTTATVFSALHLNNQGIGVISILVIFASGILFACMIYYWNSFWAAALCHTAWNFTQNIIFGLPNSGSVTPMHIFTLATDPTASFAYDPAFGIEGSIMAFVVLAGASAVIVIVGEKKRRAQVAAGDAKGLSTQEVDLNE